MGGDVKTRSWTRREYDRLVALGVLGEDEPIELVAGQLVVREPQHTPHATGVRLVDRALRRAFPDSAWQVDVGLPIALDDTSEPEPDVSVVAGGPRDYLAAHPARPVLVVEISESSLGVDRRDKASCSDPAPAADAPHGWTYREVQILAAGAAVAPLAALGTPILVDDLLP